MKRTKLKRIAALPGCLKMLGLLLVMALLASCGSALLISSDAPSSVPIEGGHVCGKCKKPIIDNYLSFEGVDYHPGCLVCTQCGQKISGPLVHDNGHFYHPECYRVAKGMLCDYCGKPLVDHWTIYEGKKYHERWFEDHIRKRCGICGKKIYDRYTTDESGEYHISCYRDHKIPVCSICSQPVEGTMIVDAWGNRAHLMHDHQVTETCSSCSRIISEKTSNGSYHCKDGRVICGICKASAVNTPAAIKTARRTVLRILKSRGIRDIPENFSVILVGENEIPASPKTNEMSRLRAYTQFITEHRGNGVKKTKATLIHILYCLPQTEFEGVLAHELMHVWLHAHDIVLPRNISEGLCNLGAMLVYQAHASEFSNILLNNMEKNQDPDYGRGYREMKRELDRLGWKGLITELKHGAFQNP